MNKKVLVYSSNSCPYCTMAKNYLDEHNISYTERNVTVDSSARSELFQMGQMGVPVIVVDGEMVVGFDKPKINKLLDIE